MDEDVVIMATLAWAGTMLLWMLRIMLILYLERLQGFA